MRAEYITKSTDYDLDLTDQVVAILARQKTDSEVFVEKICDKKDVEESEEM